MTRRSKLEAERIAWTALQGAVAGAIGAPVLGMTALQSIGMAAIMAALGALSSLTRRRLAALDKRLGIEPASGVEQ